MIDKTTRDSYLFTKLKETSSLRGSIILNKEKFLLVLKEIITEDNLNLLKNKILTLKNAIKSHKNDKEVRLICLN